MEPGCKTRERRNSSSCLTGRRGSKHWEGGGGRLPMLQQTGWLRGGAAIAPSPSLLSNGQPLSCGPHRVHSVWPLMLLSCGTPRISLNAKWLWYFIIFCYWEKRREEEMWKKEQEKEGKTDLFFQTESSDTAKKEKETGREKEIRLSEHLLRLFQWQRKGKRIIREKEGKRCKAFGHFALSIPFFFLSRLIHGRSVWIHVFGSAGRWSSVWFFRFPFVSFNQSLKSEIDHRFGFHVSLRSSEYRWGLRSYSVRLSYNWEGLWEEMELFCCFFRSSGRETLSFLPNTTKKLPIASGYCCSPKNTHFFISFILLPIHKSWLWPHVVPVMMVKFVPTK